MSAIYDYVEAGFKVFGLHGIDKDGSCECGNPKCEAFFKHPRISNWQSVPHWSDEQLETFEALGHFKTGFGVLCEGWLIIDVDARNGGVESFKKLCKRFPSVLECAFFVNTGSGGGSQHHYFRLPEPVPMVQHHPDYIGVDFKTSGFVVGSGSLHATGAEYERARGFPQDVTEAPTELVEFLRKPDRHRVSLDGMAVDVSDQEIETLLSYIDPGLSYEPWVKIGMAIHHCTGGVGFDLWDEWSSRDSKYPGTDQLEKHWHSFGKSANPAGYGTILHYARQGGYVDDVTFEYQDELPSAEESGSLNTDSIDLLRPPGFVGELTDWINSQCLYPRENLAVAAALSAVSALAGMRFVDELDGMSANLIAFCVAGSGTGKEAVAQAYLEIMRTAGIQGAVHGGFKSEQELYRNLVRHQAAFYCIDELGLVLRKLDNASKRGGASYLEGIIGAVMSAYSKSNGFLPVTGDLKEEIRESLIKDLSRAEKRLDELPADSSQDMKRGRLEHDVERLRIALGKIDDGLDSPYLTVLGYTTPVTFNDLMTFEQATNGFMARAMIFTDLETNPKRKAKFAKRRMPDSLVNAIRNLWAPGHFDMARSTVERVGYLGEKTGVPTTADAAEAMDAVYIKFHAMAEEHKATTGLEAIPRRGYELASKVSLLLAMPGGVRTAEHVRWAYALAKRDVDMKIKMTYAQSHEEEDSGLAARVLSLVTKEHGETLGVICNRLRSTPKAQVEALLNKMVESGMITVVECKHPSNGKIFKKFFGAQ